MILKLIGFIAFITSILSLPSQIYKIHLSKSAGDVSLFMLLNFLIGSVSWVLYGFMIHATSVWLSNMIWTTFSAWLIILKIKYYNK